MVSYGEAGEKIPMSPYGDSDGDGEEEEDITGNFQTSAVDKAVLLDEELSEKLIRENQPGTDKYYRRSRTPRRERTAGDVGVAGGYNRLVEEREDDNSEEIELDAESHLRHLRKKQRRISCMKTTLFLLLLAVVAMIVGGAAYIGMYKKHLIEDLKDKITNAYGGQSGDAAEDAIAKATWKAELSNGTHAFHPTTIVISLDGFRPDYLSANLTPVMYGLYNDEYAAPFMYPSFPSVTFPNHYTLVTGLYPSAHGIVGNTFWDEDAAEEFYYQHPDESLNRKWWGGQPVWVTATEQGVRTAIHMWPGSEVKWRKGDEPWLVDKFNQTETLARKRDRVLGWLDLETALRPELVLAYVPEVDSIGHRYGTRGPYMDQALVDVDTMVGEILAGVAARNLSAIVNVVVVSDHGMAPTSNDRLIFLDDIVPESSVEHIDGWPLFGLRPYAANKTADVLAQAQAARASLVQAAGADAAVPWKVYARDSMPAEWHFGGASGGQYQDRIADIWIVPEPGWAVTTRDKFYVKQKGDFHPRGLHGYNNTHPLMRALFLATGPAFPAGTHVAPFYNTEIYDVLCRSLNLTAAANNGTLGGRLPALPADWVDTNTFEGFDCSDADRAIGEGDCRPLPPGASVDVTGANPGAAPTAVAVGDSEFDYIGGPGMSKEEADWWNYFHRKLDSLTGDINDWLDKLGSDGKE
ncbi:alkaline-phosphatase-like protein [Dipodascopsis tothii]|uniref:alkaline-phosphatase-like protein n=1 Tax=Dipodascopsis tothii TaxID=44089 RepID=UPI0034CF9440